MGATAVTPAAGPRRGPLGGVSARLLRVASDEKLVAAVRQGSQPAFEVIYDRHHRGILSFCRHMLGSREEAEDALQHTYMAAYKALLDSDKDIQLKAWLYTIARNRCLSVLRARREQASDEIEIASTHGLAAEVERKVELQDLLRDLSELPEDQRAALVLSEIGDLGHDEIAGVLDVPKDKVKALVFQARSSLQQSRDARETPCEEIREMLATLSGGALRRTTLRRHVKTCPGCQVFEAEVKRQRRAMAAVLPVVPTVGLKENALAAAFSQAATGGAAVAGGAAAATAGGSLLGGGASAVVAKVLVVATVAGGGAAGVSAVSKDGERPERSRSTPAAETPAPSGGPAAVAPAATAEAQEQTDKVEGDKPRKGKRRGHTDRGKEFAKSRGKGNKRGLNGTQPGQEKKAEKGKKAKREEAKEKAEIRKARAKSRRQKAKARSREKAKRQRPARQPVRKPRPQSQEKPQQNKPEPTPEPTPDPSPTVVPTSTPEATPDPGNHKSKD